ncbi:hypothetical protein [Novosphingobium sp. FSW06-99]|uniref:hypothetical protein n=1 Tax=Novosphingobium sp. FSW06-99 TaxID=1739113 RepID=UPI00076D904B|nr:hypothetical protein [Novosphingobium sp. FSW06-99]KUR80745.1 hypothetical protein AQZ49_01575 [Novosphingobium sp. FSW06-99]
MPDPAEHGAMIATALERLAAQQRDIERVDDDVDEVDRTLSAEIKDLRKSIETLVSEISLMRAEAALRDGEVRMLKRVMTALVAIGGLFATLFSGLLTPPHH